MTRYVWAGPNSLLGCALALLALGGGRLAVVGGVLEAHGPCLRWALRTLVPIPGGAAALTLGHVVLGADAGALEATRAHERAHVRQYGTWGPAFIPAYLIVAVWLFATGRDGYQDNPFEREARREAGGTSWRAPEDCRRDGGAPVSSGRTERRT